uniref:Putative coatomer subunit beta'-3 n=1 Tax=Aegilops tauschii TaxID=37682 RepID=M8BKC7_AEGTA
MAASQKSTKLRANCMTRVKNERVHLLWKMRNQGQPPANDMLKYDAVTSLYRCEQSVRDALRSVFAGHNEILNVWKFFLGFMLNFVLCAFFMCVHRPMQRSVLPPNLHPSDSEGHKAKVEDGRAIITRARQRGALASGISAMPLCLVSSLHAMKSSFSVLDDADHMIDFEKYQWQIKLSYHLPGAQIMDHQGCITEIELENMLFDEDLEPIALPYSLLKKITDDFSDKLEVGRGGFAVVYKAILDNGVVAVKRLSNTYMYEEKFQGEIECLMKAKHKNIVRFLGYCSDTQGNMESYNGKWVMADVQQRLLCFEYLPKGSLDGHITDLFGEIEWRKRYNIIKGDMMPKITDFGLSRCFEEDQTRVITKNVAGTMGYLAPECYCGEKIAITHKFDLYSLGVIIIEILTGKKGYQIAIENVLEIWSNMMLDALQWEQLRVCARIGIECTDLDPGKRPASMKHIVDALAQTECSTHLSPAGGESELLLLQQFTLCFPFEPNKVITCPLQLTNNTDKHVAFRLTDKSMESSFIRLPLYGIVPPNTPFTLIITTQEKEELPQKYIIDVILHNATLILEDDEYINTFQSQPDNFFREMGNAVQEVKLKALYTLPRHITPSLSKIILQMKSHNKYDEHMYALDTNQARQWIIIGDSNGYVGFWDYHAQAKYGDIQVYDYEKKKMITSFRVGGGGPGELLSMAVHPNKPYLLSAGWQLKLWDWDKDWECVHTFGDNFHSAYQVAVNPNNTIATASVDLEGDTVKIWSLDSPKSNYALSGHSGRVTCLDYFTCHDQEFLVTGSDDQTAKIWYLQKKICVYTLEAFISPVMSVLYHTNLQTLIIGSEDGAIYLWSTANCSVAIAKGNTVAIMDINNVDYQEQSTYCNKQPLGADTRQHAEDRASKEVSGSINMLPILDIHPLELCFPYHPNEPISCSLELRNNTDENVAFRLVDKSGKSPWCFTKLPLYGIVPRRSTCNLIVTTKEEMKLKEKKDFNLVIQSSLLRDKYTMVFQNHSECDLFFEEAKEFGNMVHEVILKAVYLRYEETPSKIVAD